MRAFAQATSQSQKPALAPPQPSRVSDARSPGRLSHAADPLWSRPGEMHFMQTKLAIGALLDPGEHEVDRVAREVMRVRGSQVEDVATPQPQAHAGGATGPGSFERSAVAPIVDEVLSRSGQPLDGGARAFMEPRFGRDFSQVRVHADELAGRSAHAVGAHAYTAGSQIVFGQGRFAPTT